MMRAQASLEYLIIIAAVIGIAAVVVYTLSGVMSSQSSSASIATCKQAAIDCKASRMLTPNDPCFSCDTACSNPATGKEIFAGALECCKSAMVEDLYEDSVVCAMLVPCGNGQARCADGSCKTPACSGTSCGTPDPGGCIQSITCGNPNTCDASCSTQYKSTGSSCGTGYSSSSSCSGNQKCTTTTDYKCDSSHNCVSNVGTSCTDCSTSGRCCLGTSPNAYCGTCPPNCGIITCSGSTPYCCNSISCCTSSSQCCGISCCSSGQSCCGGSCCSGTCCGALGCCGAGYQCCTFPSTHCCLIGHCGAFGGCS
jgi:hypothetical protein